MENDSSMERRQLEIELLQAMYPDQITFDLQSWELKYNSSLGGTLVLRLPTSYPDHGFPDVIGAVDGAKNDLRQRIKVVRHEENLCEGEEVLDQLIQKFEETLTHISEVKTPAAGMPSKGETVANTMGDKTVIIWLHHLLNTNKRKLALNPTVGKSSQSKVISGLTKPGYPGILVFSGPADLINGHVGELRQQRWQAFQIRFEEEHDPKEAWQFEHGAGIREVESMADVVQGITGETHRADFLKATGVK